MPFDGIGWYPANENDASDPRHRPPGWTPPGPDPETAARLVAYLRVDAAARRTGAALREPAHTQRRPSPGPSPERNRALRARAEAPPPRRGVDAYGRPVSMERKRQAYELYQAVCDQHAAVRAKPSPPSRLIAVASAVRPGRVTRWW